MKIAYLAPEIPGLSSTFVNNEILWLEANGHTILPVSVHPTVNPENPGRLAERTCYLYPLGLPSFLAATLHSLITRPGRLLRAAALLVADIFSPDVPGAYAVKLAYQFLAANRLARILQQTGCAHLHVHFMNVPTQIGMYAAVLARIPFTVTAHANDIFDHPILLKTKSRRASRIITISEYNREYLRQQGLAETKIAIVRCATPSSGTLERPPPRKAHDTIRIGSLGRLVEKKGMDTLITCVGELVAAGTRVHLEIAGDGPLRQTLERQVALLALGEHVTFRGEIRNEDVPAWLATLDIFVLACRTDARGDMDGIPVAIMEAMAHHVPVVSTRLSGIPELVIHRQTGLLAEPGDAAGLAAQIRALIDDPAWRQRLARQAHRHVSVEFGVETNIARLASVFREAQNRHPASPTIRGDEQP